MPSYSQADRAFKVETVLGPDKLLLEGFSGQERISQPFQYLVELVSQDKAVSPLDLLRTKVTLSVEIPGGSARHFHGLINRFVQLGQAGDLTSYEAEVVPWLWFLSLTADCRIFQNQSVLEIVEEIFSKYPEADYQNKCVGAYEPREYCVQYRETDLHFVSRLLEEEGIFYYFVHSDSGHKLILMDDTSMVEPCPVRSKYQVATTAEASYGEGVITDLRREHVVNPTRVTLRDYDFLQPKNTLHATQGSDEQGEIYDYPGEYLDLDRGERYANLHLQERTTEREVIRGASTCRTLATGFKFELDDYYIAAANQHYLVVGAGHQARGGGYRSGKAENTYSNQFDCVPATTPFRPPRLTPRPFVQGSQTAVVAGPSGEEIHTDKHGRVKVQFHWDRLGKNDEKSSCWIRVSQPWAGKNWGSVTIPRIGQEVIVEFLEGDPDFPIITGRVYNADQVPPYELPANQTQSGTKSRSTKGGGKEDFNEIRFEDKKGSEELYIHAQKDKKGVVENDDTLEVGNNQVATIKKDRTHEVKENDKLEVGNNQVATIKKDRTHEVKENDKLKVGQKLDIDAGESVTIKTGAATVTMKSGGDINIKGGNITIEGSATITVKASGTGEVNAGGPLTIKGAIVSIN